MLLDGKHDFGIENPKEAVCSDAAESSITERGETLEKFSRKSKRRGELVSARSKAHIPGEQSQGA